MYNVKFWLLLPRNFQLGRKVVPGMKLKHRMEKLYLYSIHNFTELEKICKDAVLIKRARHVIGEIERTKRAAESLKSQDFRNVSCSIEKLGEGREKFETAFEF